LAVTGCELRGFEKEGDRCPMGCPMLPQIEIHVEIQVEQEI
jgi:hypothetical protein